MKNKNIALNSSTAKYILFIDDYEMYQINPYKQVIIREAFKDQAVKGWKLMDVIIGEDLQDLGVDIGNYTTHTWFATERPSDQTFKALVGLV
jgi:hypothetical protein